MNESSCCFPSLPVFGVLSLLDLGHSNRFVVVSHCCGVVLEWKPSASVLEWDHLSHFRDLFFLQSQDGGHHVFHVYPWEMRPCNLAPHVIWFYTVFEYRHVNTGADNLKVIMGEKLEVRKSISSFSCMHLWLGCYTVHWPQIWKVEPGFDNSNKILGLASGASVSRWF